MFTEQDFADFFMTPEQVEEAERIKAEACDAIEAANVRKFGIFVEFPIITDEERAAADQYPYFGEL